MPSEINPYPNWVFNDQPGDIGTRGFTRAQMWSAIERMSRGSHSIATRNMLLLRKAFLNARMATGQTAPDPHLNMQAMVERDSGRIVTETA